MFSVEISMPPSLNNAYRNIPGKGRVKSAEYASWMNDAVTMFTVLVPASKRVPGPVSVSIVMPQKMRGDIDNRVKPILDALVKSGRVDDDRNVTELYVKKLRASDLVLVTVQAAI
jgi:Holliday junction resolvase RusA-like endonuclease